jgi:MFS family permease
MRFLSLPPLGHLPSFSVGLSLGQLVTWGSVFYTFALLAHPIELALNLSRAESSFAFSLALLGEGLLAFWVGRWIDAGYERRVMTGGSIVVGLGLLAHSQVNSLTEFYGVWAWLGLGLSATLYTPAFAVVTRRFPNDFRRAIIMMTFLGGLASTVFIPLSSWLIDTWGWRHALVVLGLVQLGVCVPLHAWLLRGARPGLAQESTHRTKQDGALNGAAPELMPVRVSVRVFLKQSPFWLLSLFMILMMMVTSALPVHLVNLLRESGLPPAWVLAIPASIGVIQVVGRALLFVFERHLDVHAANRWIPVLIPLGLCALVFGGVSAVPAMWFVLLFGLGNGLNTIVKGTAFAQYVSRDHVGQLNGLLGVPIALARAAAPWALGLLWSPEGGYAVGLRWVLLCGLLSVVALWLAQARALRLHKPL